MRKLGISIFVTVFILISVIALFGATPPSTPVHASHANWVKEYESWEKRTYEAAKKEGKAVWYTGESKDCTDAMVDAFGKKYPGVKLEIQSGRGTQVSARITTEQDAKKVLGDLLSTGLSVLRPMATEDRSKYFIPPAIKEPGVKWLVDPLREQDNFKGKPFPMVLAADPRGMIINTKLVPPEKGPKGWQSLLDPWWKGKIISDDPRASGSANKEWFWMREIYGEEFWRKLAAQNIAIEKSLEICSRAVATGEYYVSLSLGPREFIDIGGSPTKFVVPSEGTVLVEISVFIVNGSPHPNAAELFMNFLYTKAGQDVFGTTGSRTPLRADAKLKYPEQNLVGLKLLATTMQQDATGVVQTRKDVKKYLGE